MPGSGTPTTPTRTTFRRLDRILHGPLDDTCTWQPPIARPDDDKSYTWNEETQSWDEDDLLA